MEFPLSILVVEDDMTVNQLVCEQLREAGYQTESAVDGLVGEDLACQKHFDLIILDIMLPGKSGLDILRSLRTRCQTPVLMLTARGGEEDRIRGFRTGADDYLTKPFNMTELHLRIEAILRRAQPQLFSEDNKSSDFSDVIRFDSQQVCVSLDLSGRSEDIQLTLLEFDLLKTLADHSGEVMTKAFLYQSVLLREFSRYDRTLDMHISKIRKKLNAAGAGMNVIKTVRGQGYCLDINDLRNL